jgi:conjugal transfer/type IV secretion protein DotA/TraY
MTGFTTPPTPKPAEARRPSTLRFLFNPEFGQSLQPLKETHGVFVHLILSLFVAYGLISRDHPLCQRGAKPRLLSVLLAGFRSLRWERGAWLQIVLYFLVVGIIGGTFLFITLLALGLFVTPANAQSYFTAPNPTTDWAGQWIAAIRDNTAWSPKSGIEVKFGKAFSGFQEIVSFMSKGMLIIASLILFYHLGSMTAETAVHGQFMGKRASYLWAPLRLVFAIALLVPTPSGFNAGQYVVLTTAEWGSAFASNAWDKFINTFNATPAADLPQPSSPEIAKLVGSMIAVALCVDGHVIEGRTTGDYIWSDAKTYQTSTGVAALFGGTTTRLGYCGGFNFDLATSGSPEERIQLAHKEAFLEVFGEVRRLTRILAQSFYPASGAVSAPSISPSVFLDITKLYERLLKTKLAAAGSAAASSTTSVSISDNRGWATAGLWLYKISKIQGQLMEFSGNLPKANLPSLKDTTTGLDAAISSATARAYYWVTTGRTDMPDVGAKNSDDISSVLNSLNAAAVSYGLWNNEGPLVDSVFGGSFTLDPANTLGGLASLGWRKLLLSFDLIQWAVMGTLAESVMSGIGGALMLASIPTLASGVGAPVAVGLAGAGAVIGVASKIVAGIGATAISLLMTLAMVAFSAAILLAFIIPLMPFFKFLFGILAWLLAIFEAIICVPLWALAHLSPEGDSFMPQSARYGYNALFQIFLRPILMVLSLITSLFLLTIVIGFLNFTFSEATHGIHSAGSKSALVNFVYMIIYAVNAYMLTNATFKTVEHLPNSALKWFGGGHGDQVFDDQQTFNTMVVATGGFVSQAGQAVQSGVRGGLQSAGQGVAGLWKGK